MSAVDEGSGDDGRRQEELEVNRVVTVLRGVMDPETGVNVVDEGLLYGVTVEGSWVQVFLRFASTTPACNFCRMLAMNVQRRITEDVIRALRGSGFDEVKVYDEFGLLLDEG